MYSVLANRLIRKDSLVGTFTKDEMITYLLDELNEIAAAYQLCEGVRDELENALSEIDDLENELSDLRESLERR